MCTKKTTQTRMCLLTLFIIDKNWKQAIKPSKKARNKRIHTVWFHLYETPEKTNLIWVIESRSIITWLGMRWVWSQPQGNWVSDENVLYFDCPAGYLNILIFQDSLRDTQNECIWLYVNLNLVHKEMEKGKKYIRVQKRRS